MQNNPPAFPRTGEGFGSPKYDEPGMSLRDYFAGQALIGMGTWIPNLSDGMLASEKTQAVRAELAYSQADAMLKARAEGREM